MHHAYTVMATKLFMISHALCFAERRAGNRRNCPPNHTNFAKLETLRKEEGRGTSLRKMHELFMKLPPLITDPP